ncbi:MAG: hypothetical protein H6584_05650 [Flavobacteriales bacterium]|nr:hypothetical protein [Flavobacteriales bacterium]
MKTAEKIIYGVFLMLLVSCVDGAKKYKSDNTLEKKQVDSSSVIIASGNLDHIISFQKKKVIDFSDIKGKVSKITQTNFWYKKEGDSTIEKIQKLKTEVLEFNEEQQLILYNVYADDEELFFTNKYIYDEEGCLITSYESNAVRFVVKKIPVYNPQGIIVKEKYYNKDEIEIGEAVIGLKQDTLTKVTTWANAGTKEKTINVVDMKGNFTFSVFYETVINAAFNSSAETAEELQYDEKGRVVSESKYIPWGITENYKDRLDVSIQNKYGDNNLLREKIVTKNGVVDYVLSYAYVFDAMGNWIEKNITRNNKKESVHRRMIEYY